MMDVVQTFLQLAGILIVVLFVNYYFIIPTVILAIIFYCLRAYYMSSSRNIKRMEAISKSIAFIFDLKKFNEKISQPVLARSPIYSYLSASLNGLSTIRAFGVQPILVKEFDQLHKQRGLLFIYRNGASIWFLVRWVLCDLYCFSHIKLFCIWRSRRQCWFSHNSR